MLAALPNPARRAALRTNLAQLRQRIADACVAAGRDPSEVTLIAVTKTFPASDVALLAELGVREIGENRDQEAKAKVAALSAFPDLRWHFLGRLQRNKCRSVASYASVVHSVDRFELVTALGDAAATVRDNPLDVLVQVSLDLPSCPDSQLDTTRRRGGIASEAVLDLAGAITQHSELNLRGVMGIPPRHISTERAFAQLAEVSWRMRAVYASATWISAGMSGDLTTAIAAGATHVRVGTALLGIR